MPGTAHTDDTLDALAQALQVDDVLGGSAWFDRQTHAVILLTVDPEDLDDGPAPAWAREEQALAARIAAAPERWLRIEPTGDPGRLRRFLYSIDDPDLAARLDHAVRGGRGATRRVRTALRRLGQEDLWHQFEVEADRELARTWLVECGVGSEAPTSR